MPIEEKAQCEPFTAQFRLQEHLWGRTPTPIAPSRKHRPVFAEYLGRFLAA